jgi:MerR family transcriptional regulator, light-induced transcriptional regulator
MLQPVRLDRRRLSIALSEVEAIRDKIPEPVLADLAQEVVKRVATNLRVVLPPDLRPSSGQIDALCDALLSHDPGLAVTMIDRAQQNGASYDTLCQYYLAAASARLGEWWIDDRVSFYKVTIAAGRIYAILRTLRLNRQLPEPDGRRFAVFANVPGDDHNLGIRFAADLARDRGWDIELLTGRTHDELLRDLLTSDTGLIGLSASGKEALPALLKLIVALRLSNPKARIMVCGRIASLGLNLDGITGADFASADFDPAFNYMERLAREARGG